MASTASLASPLPSPVTHSSTAPPPPKVAHPAPRCSTRRDCLLLLTAATTALPALPSTAADIPLFGLRKKLEKAEKQAEELVKESFETAEKGIVAAEKGVETAEKEIQTAAVSLGFRLGGFAQAGAMAGAELLGLLLATSLVNSILGPDPKNS